MVTRKLPLSGGAHVRGFSRELKEVADTSSNIPAFGETSDRLKVSIFALEAASNWLMEVLSAGHTTEALAGATPYQRLFGLTLTGYYLAKGALVRAGNGVGEERVALCRFMAEYLLAETSALEQRIVLGAGSLEAARGILA